ncbi:hypothetical protein [Tritonibacter horizontis]|uniref:Uncharacterized protein n=1 Tax=Tritonibacter horizontis TaxID=1768241 RepID=A0A132BSI4_9RHOB|nr:hypothetical protein [Tritonibacter horizontis]KUP91313.1 hypothetical protein TRIHO_38870 [Tritonibacter horizontis]
MTETLESALSEISTLLEKRLKLTGAVSDCLIRARRHLPPRHRRAAADLAAAEAAFEHPKLAMMLDEAKLLRQARGLRLYLAEVDLADRRKGRLLDIGASVGFALLTVIALLVCVLSWRGFV